MKVLKEFEFRREGRLIPYKAEWFSGDIVQLNHKDLGLEPDDEIGSVVQSLRKKVTNDHPGWKLRTSVITDDKNVQHLVVQAVKATAKK